MVFAHLVALIPLLSGLGGCSPVPVGIPPGADPGTITRRIDDALLLQLAEKRHLAYNDPVISPRLVLAMWAADPAGMEGRPDVDVLTEALGLGLQRYDPIARRRMIELAENALVADLPEPDDQALEAWRTSHAPQFTRPARTSISEVFSRSESGADAVFDQVRRERPPPSAAWLLGDPRMDRREIAELTDTQLLSTFGPDGPTLLSVPLDTWVGPLRSPAGLHLVRVIERVPPVLPPLDSIRNEVRADLLRALRREHLDEQKATLRAGSRTVLVELP